MKKVLLNLFVAIFLFQCVVYAQQPEVSSFDKRANKFAGIYHFDNQRYIIIMPHPDLELLSIYDMETGDVRPLELQSWIKEQIQSQ